MFLIWSTYTKSKVLNTLAPVLQGVQGVPIEVRSSWEGLQPKTILALGKEPLEFLGSEKVVAKGRTITSLRGQVFRFNGAQLMLSYSPGIQDNDYRHYIDLLTDFSSAIRLYQTGKTQPEYGDYRYVDDFSDLIAYVNAKYAETGKPVDVAGDLETLGLDEFALPGINPDTGFLESSYPGAYIVSVQFTYRPKTADLVYFNNRREEEAGLSDMVLAEQIAWILSTPKISIRGANFKYDLRWLTQRGGFECTNFKMDTTLVGSILDENRSNGLDVHAKIYVPRLAGYSDAFDKLVDKSRMDLVPKEKLLPYAGGDTDATYDVAIAEKEELLKDAVLTRFYVNILHPAARAFEFVERGGILVDREKFRALDVDLTTELVRLVHKAKAVLGGRIVAKHTDAEKRGGMNITKASLIKDYMFSPMGLNLKPQMLTEKTKEPSSSLDHLLLFKDVPEAQEFVGLLKDYASASKTQSTYVVGFLKNLRSDGRFHPSFWFFAGDKDEGDGGTNTGRLSCKSPAFQTIPKHTKWARRIRECYPAPPGHVVMERDYSQGELKIAACIANEETMIQAYLNGMDLHALTSGRFAGYTYEEMMALKKADKEAYDAIRQLGKAGNFGLLYGMGADGFYVYAIENYGVKNFTLADAGAFRTGFFDTYPGLVEYHKKYKAMAKKDGCIYSPLGRIRHLPLIRSPNSQERSKAERQAINAPVQATLSDLLLWTTAEEHACGLSKIAPSFGACHDAGYNYVPEDQVGILVPRHLEIMENLPLHKVGWKPQLKFTADAKIGPDMANLKEWKP